MARYIDIDETVKTFEKLHGEESSLLNCYNADWIVSFLEAQPTADVVQVVRCKDCKYFNGKIDVLCERCGDIDEPCGGCHYTGGCTYDDGYCHHGKRRKEDAEIH